jgi:hypothetical protein
MLSDLSLSRRSFILSTATAFASCSSGAAFASSIFDEKTKPLHVVMVGFGRHAQRFLDSVTRSALYVDAVIDPDTRALDLAAVLTKHHQGALPDLIKSSEPFLDGHLSTPALLCSPPDTWATLVPHLSKHGRPILAHHTRLFAAPYWPGVLRTVTADNANLLLVGIDPAFPIRSINSFHTFARSRGASNVVYRLFHPAWPSSELLAFHFDCLNAALPQEIRPEDSQWQFSPMPTEHDFSGLSSGGSSHGLCSISTVGPGIAFGTSLHIAQDPCTSTTSEYCYQFAHFCRSSQRVRNLALRRQSAMLKMVRSSAEPISLFM